MSMSSPGEVRPREEGGPGPETKALLGGRYLLQRVLGDGGFSTVYAAYDRKILSSVAVKLLKAWCGESEKRRFGAEIVICGRMNHPHIVRVMDGGEYQGRPYSVMPLLPGRTLLRRRGEHWQKVSGLLRQYLEGLRALHDANAFVAAEHRSCVLHRDVKPANCIVSDADHVTIIDLGLAKPIDMSVRATRTGTVVGSTAYMAPECLLLQEPASEGSDVYALGVSFYEMLTGELPYCGDLAELRAQLTECKVARSVRTLRPEIPAALAELVQSAMAPVSSQRPRSLAAMLASLDTILMRSNAWDPELGLPPRVRAPRVASRKVSPARPMPGAPLLAVNMPAPVTPPRERLAVGVFVLGSVSLSMLLILGFAGRLGGSAPESSRTASAAVRTSNRDVPLVTKRQVRAALQAEVAALRACPGAPGRLALTLEVGERVKLVELQYAPVDPREPFSVCVQKIVEKLPIRTRGPVLRHAVAVELLVAAAAQGDGCRGPCEQAHAGDGLARRREGA